MWPIIFLLVTVRSIAFLLIGATFLATHYACFVVMLFNNYHNEQDYINRIMPLLAVWASIYFLGQIFLLYCIYRTISIYRNIDTNTAIISVSDFNNTKN